jgi:hypothetical protein
MDNLKDKLTNEAESQPSCLGAVMASTPTVYLMDIDNEATVVIARNIAEAMDKAEKIAKKDYKMVYSKSLPLLY